MFSQNNYLTRFAYLLKHDSHLGIDQDVSTAYCRSSTGDSVDLLILLLLFKPTNPIRQVTVATAKELIYGGTLSLLRGTQRLFSVKCLFGEANIA